MYYYIAHKGALWRLDGPQYRKLVHDIRAAREEVDLTVYGGRLLTGRVVILEHLIQEVTIPE